MIRSRSRSSSKDKPRPSARPIPTFLPDLRQEVTWALENPITGHESGLVYEWKKRERRELYDDADRELLTELHKELFRDFSPTAPAWTISQKEVATMKRVEESVKYYAEHKPEWLVAEEEYAEAKEQLRRENISKGMPLSHNQES